MPTYPLTLRFPIHWNELDALGHVNNARYFTWFESARMALFEEIGLATSGDPETGPILAHTRCDFLRPVHYPARIEVGARISRIGRSSFTMEYQVVLEESPQDPMARGEGVVVLVHYGENRSIPIPDPLREALERFSG